VITDSKQGSKLKRAIFALLATRHRASLLYVFFCFLLCTLTYIVIVVVLYTVCLKDVTFLLTKQHKQ